MKYVCQNCGSNRVVQTIKQTEYVVADENGEPLEFEHMDYVDILSAECYDCGAIIYGENNDN